MQNSQFIGRVDELQLMQNIYNEAINGLGKLIFISGNPGLGKSGLVREFLSRAEKEGNCITAIAECNDKEGLNPYAPFKELLLKLNTAAVSDTKEKKAKTLQKLKSFITEAGTQWIGMIPVVGGVAQAGLETYKAYQDHFGNKDGEKVQSEDDIYRIFENEFRRLAQNKTLILFLDDLQWADSSSLNLIFSLGKSIRENPFSILIIGTYREYDVEAGKNRITETGQNITVRHPLADKLNELRNYTKQEIHISRKDQWLHEVSLKPLNNDEVIQLINSNFHKNSFTDDFYRKIQQLTNGQPLYLVEILDYLIKNNNIKQSNDGSYYTENVQLDNLPVSVQAIINEKVERLSDDLKKVLSYASVSGEEFAVQVIEKLLKIDELDLLDYLEELSKKHGLLVADEPVHVKNMLFELYRFTQTLVHKHIYENLDGARRRALHRRIAETLKNLYGDELEKNKEVNDKFILHTQIGQGLIDGVTLQLAEIKNNTTETEIPAVDSFIEAANSEIKLAKENFEQFAVSECFARIDKALGFLAGIKGSEQETDKVRYSALSIRNKAQQWSGFYQEAYHTAQEMMKLADKLNDSESKGISQHALGKAVHGLGRYDEAIVYQNKAKEIFVALNNKKKIVECLNEMAFAKEMQNLYNHAIDLLNEALEFCENIDDEALAGETLWLLANSQRKKGANDSAQSLYEHALEIFEKLGNQKQVGLIYNSLGLNAQGKGEYNKSIEWIQKALDIAKKQNDKINISNRLNNIGLANQLLGDFQTALDFYKQTLELDKSLNDRPKMAISYNNIGGIYTTLGEFETAHQYFDYADEIYQSLKDKAGLAFNYSSTALCYFEEGDMETAKEFIQKSIQIDIEIDDQISLGNDFLMLGNIYYRNAENELAKSYYLKAVEIYESTEDNFSVAIINNNLGGIEHAMGNYEKAIAHYEFAFEIYKKTDDKLNMAMLQGNMGNTYKDLKDFNKSKAAYSEAVKLYKELSDYPNLGKHLQNFGYLYFNNQKYTESIEKLQESMRVYEQLNDINQVVYLLNDVADAYSEMDQNKQAIGYYEKSINEWISQSKIELAIRSLHALASFYKKNNELEKSLDIYQRAAKLAIESGNNTLFFDTKITQAFTYKKLDDLGKAFDMIKEGLEHAYKIQDTEYQAKCHKEMGWLYYNENAFDKAIEMCERAIEFHRHFDDDFELADTFYLMAEAMAVHEELFTHHQEIDEYLNKALELYMNLDDLFNAAYCLNSMGSNFIAKGDFQSAIAYLNKAKQYMVEYDPGYDIGFIEDNIVKAKANLTGGGIDRPGAV